MAGGELKAKVAQGVAWSMAEKIGTMLLQVGISLVMLNLLSPDDYGLIAVLTAFSAFALVFVDSGFSQMLLRKSNPTPEDYKSVFIFNVTVSIALYVALVAVSPFVADYYLMPQLSRLAPVFFLLLIINALCVIQNTIYTRQFRFALLSKVTFFASLISGFVAIGMALAGFGIWSLVAQRLVQMVVRGSVLWWLSDWRPTALFSGSALRAMAPFSFSLLFTELISSVYNKFPSLFIAKIYGVDTLGYFDQAQKLKDSPVVASTGAIQGVTFTALSKISGDEAKFSESYRQLIMVVAFAMFPMMVGLSAVGDDLFVALVDQKWLPTIPYFRAICLAGLFYPLSVVSYNVLKVRCLGREIIRLEVIKKLIMTLVLAVTIFQGVMAVIWGLVVISFCEMVANFWATTRVSTFGTWRFIRTLMPIAVATSVMYLAVMLVDRFVDTNALVALLVKIMVGSTIYIAISAIFRFEAFVEVLSIIRSQLRSLRQ